MTDAARIMARIEDEGVRTVDLRFTDLTGRWRHTSVEAKSVTGEILKRGILIDGAAVPGWRDVADSDLLLRPDLATDWADPFAAQPTLVLLCDTLEPAAAMDYERDPRSTARRAETALAGRTLHHACEHTVSVINRATVYGSQFAFGRRSSM